MLLYFTHTAVRGSIKSKTGSPRAWSLSAPSEPPETAASPPPDPNDAVPPDPWEEAFTPAQNNESYTGRIDRATPPQYNTTTAMLASYSVHSRSKRAVHKSLSHGYFQTYTSRGSVLC